MTTTPTFNLFAPQAQAAAQVAPVAAPVVALPGMGDDAWLAASQALTAVHPTPAMARPFHPWQTAAYAFCQQSIARWGGVLVGDDMGMGKTAVALALAADAVAATGAPAIIIAPPVTYYGWMTELAAMFPGLTLANVRGHSRKPLPQADVYFVSDDSRTMQCWLTDVTVDSKGHKHFAPSDFAQTASIIIRDEIHRDKGNDSKPSGRSHVMMCLGRHCRASDTPIVGMTGTLITNRPVDGYIPLQVVGGERLVEVLTPGAATIKGYLRRYCGQRQVSNGRGGYVTKNDGCDKDEALRLHEYLRRTVYVRREKSDLGEGVLPHFGWIVKPLALDDQTMRRYYRIEHEFYTLLCEERGQVWADKAKRGEAIVKMNMMIEEAGVAKAVAAAEYAQELVDNGEQVILFYTHNRVWEQMALTLHQAGVEYVTINGKVTDNPDANRWDRSEAIASFQAGDARVCLAQITAAGVGVTLTAARHAVFVQCPWAAGSLSQAAGRNRRVDEISAMRASLGEDVQYHVLQAAYDDGDESIDMSLWSVLERKTATADAINAGKAVTMDVESVQHETLMAWQPSKRHGMWKW